MYGKCKGFEGAFCTKDEECFKSSNPDNAFFCMPNYRDFDDSKANDDESV